MRVRWHQGLHCTATTAALPAEEYHLDYAPEGFRTNDDLSSMQEPFIIRLETPILNLTNAHLRWWFLSHYIKFIQEFRSKSWFVRINDCSYTSVQSDTPTVKADRCCGSWRRSSSALGSVDTLQLLNMFLVESPGAGHHLSLLRDVLYVYFPTLGGTSGWHSLFMLRDAFELLSFRVREILRATAGPMILCFDDSSRL